METGDRRETGAYIEVITSPVSYLHCVSQSYTVLQFLTCCPLSELLSLLGDTSPRDFTESVSSHNCYV